MDKAPSVAEINACSEQALRGASESSPIEESWLFLPGSIFQGRKAREGEARGQIGSGCFAVRLRITVT